MTRSIFAPKLEPFALVVKKRGGGERVIEPDSFFINRNTAAGEDADIYERMPHQGRRYIPWRDVIRQEPRT